MFSGGFRSLPGSGEQAASPEVEIKISEQAFNLLLPCRLPFSISRESPATNESPAGRALSFLFPGAPVERARVGPSSATDAQPNLRSPLLRAGGILSEIPSRFSRTEGCARTAAALGSCGKSGEQRGNPRAHPRSSLLSLKWDPRFAAAAFVRTNVPGGARPSREHPREGRNKSDQTDNNQIRC